MLMLFGYAFFAALLFILDLLSKSWALRILEKGQLVPWICFFKECHLDFVRVHNKGVSFGFLSGMLSPYVFLVISGGLVAYLLFCFFKSNHHGERLGYTLVVAGALGNMWDRLQYGSVVDFLYFHWAWFKFSIFNGADIFISLGVALLFVHFFFCSSKKRVYCKN